MVKQAQARNGTVRHQVWQPESYKGISIGIKSSPNELHFPKQFLHDYTIVINGQGQGSVCYRSKKHVFTNIQNLVFLQQPGEVFTGSFKGEAGTGGACIALPPSAINQHKKTLGAEGNLHFADLLLPDPANNLVAHLTTRTIESFAKPTCRLERESQLLSLVQAVLRYGSKLSLPERKLGREHQAVTTIKAFFHAHPGHEHSIEALGRLTRLNPKYLIDVFSRDVGLPPHRYLVSLRVHKAKGLLTKGMAIDEIARELGFCDQSHFSNTFKRYVQVSPGQFKDNSASKT